MNPSITPKLLTPEQLEADLNLLRHEVLNVLSKLIERHIAALELQNKERDRALVSATLDKCREFSDRQLGVPSRHHADAIIASVDREIRGEGNNGE